MVEFLFVLAILAYLGFVGFKAYLFFRPDQWAELRRQKLDREAIEAEERKAKNRKVAGEILGGVTKVIIDALKNKH